MDENIFKYMDVSTAHITARDNELLGLDGAGITEARCGYIIVYPYEYGYFIPVTREKNYNFANEPNFFGELSKSFKKIYFKAIANGCYLIRLDCDGMDHDDLDTHNW